MLVLLYIHPGGDKSPLLWPPTIAQGSVSEVDKGGNMMELGLSVNQARLCVVVPHINQALRSEIWIRYVAHWMRIDALLKPFYSRSSSYVCQEADQRFNSDIYSAIVRYIYRRF
jgi:hypothetical protein